MTEYKIIEQYSGKMLQESRNVNVRQNKNRDGSRQKFLNKEEIKLTQ